MWRALLLLSTVILVNGWTDAPNAIATCVAANALSFRKAVFLAAGANLLGVLSSAAVSDAVARTLFSVADFGAYALPALTAALAATVIWAIAAWRFGIPTSESHALLAGLIGAALGLGQEHLRFGPLVTVAFGLGLSLLLGWLLGRIAAQVLPPGGPRFYAKGQIFGAALSAFFHGAQDGQKFLGVFALIFTLGSGDFYLPVWAPGVCAAFMAFGTLLGGQRIIDTIGRQMVILTPRTGFAADLGCAVSLAVCTLGGFPVSTTHAKTAAIFGAGSTPNSQIAAKLGITWILTFPGCGLIAFLLVKCPAFW